MQQARWYIQMFGGLRVSSGGAAAADEGIRGEERVITRFTTQKTGALLAYLACRAGRSHPREVLIEMLWPGDNLASGRHSLSMALSSLRHQLEPPGVPAGAVIVADRQNVGVNPLAVTSDVALFDAALQAAAQTPSLGEKTARLSEAVTLYSGQILPGYYEEWVLTEQGRREAEFVQAATLLADLREKSGDLPGAVAAAQKAVSAEPLDEAAQHRLLRLLLAGGQAGEARRRYEEFSRRLLEDTGSLPGADLLKLRRRIEARHAGADSPFGEETLPPEATVVPAPVPAAPLSGMLPNGTVTFLLADAELEAPDDAEREIRERRLEKGFRVCGGHILASPGSDPKRAAEPRYFVTAFAAAGDALRAAVAGQRDAANNDLPPLRMALHSGDVLSFAADSGAYDLANSEPARHAVRLLLAGNGGQILVSDSAAALLRSPSPQALPGTQFVDLGLFRLRNANEGEAEAVPERLFRVAHADLTTIQGSEPAPPRVPAAYQANLPLTFTRFFGRDREIEQIRALLRDPLKRVVTLTGPGGTGKTRTALQVAERLTEAFGGRVCFVPLAEVTSGPAVLDAVVTALRLPPQGSHMPLDRIAASAEGGRLLLLLDNFEQVAAEGASVVQELLEKVGAITCLVTSRHLLNLTMEQEFALGPLPTPPSTLERPDQIRLFEAVQVFVDRAQTVRPDFQITAHNAGAVATLCHRLEGLPLALELAASRAQVLTPIQMLGQLQNRFQFLVSRRTDKSARHRSLFAAIEWSYRLLAPDLAAFFNQLSVFRGGWSLEAAETVCGQPLAIDYLAQLRECSLIVSEETDSGEMRFRMLETLREFAWMQLSPPSQLDLSQRHRAFMRQFAHTASAGVATSEQPRWLRLLETEHNNLRAALRFRRDDRDDALENGRLAVDLITFRLIRGHLREGGEDLETALERTRTASSEGDPVVANLRAAALSGAGEIAWMQGKADKARLFLEECVVLRRTLGEPRGIATALNNLGNIANGQNDHEVARALYEESLVLYREIGNSVGIARTLNNLGVLAGNAENHGSAQQLFEESLQLRRQIGDPRGIAIVLLNLGNIQCDADSSDAARASYWECLQLCCELGERYGIAGALDGFANLARLEGDPLQAARFFGAAANLREKAGIHLAPSERKRQEAQVLLAKNAAGAVAFDNAFVAGAALTLDVVCVETSVAAVKRNAAQM